MLLLLCFAVKCRSESQSGACLAMTDCLVKTVQRVCFNLCIARQGGHRRLRRSQSDLRKSVSQFFGHSDAVKEMMNLVVSTYLLFDKTGKGFIYYVSIIDRYCCYSLTLLTLTFVCSTRLKYKVSFQRSSKTP